MTKTIICRADGNATIGLGHLYRMFALYEIYKNHYNICFITRKDSSLHSIPSHYKLITIPTHINLDEEPKWIYSKFKPSEKIIIADGYHFIDDYQKQLRALGFFLVYVDDLVTQKLFANIVINHAPALKRILFNVPKTTWFALGTKYAILRPLFLNVAKQKRFNITIDTAFVCFGGADNLDLTSKVVMALLEFKVIKKIHVVLGGAYKPDAIISLAKGNLSVHIHKNLSEKQLITVMQDCNFAIVPSSTILYEICCVKMPVLSGYYVDNQIHTYKSFLEHGAIFAGGDFSKYTVDNFKSDIKNVLKTHSFNSYIENQSRLFDENIKVRFLNLLLPIKFRPATVNDTTLIFNWSNDALVRQNSFNSAPINFQEHQQWFLEKLKDKNQMFLIAIVAGVDAALVRYAVNSTHAVVSITISKAYRGKQLASRILIASAQYYFQICSLPIFAYIKKNNTASIKSFENAGYEFLKTTAIQKIETFVYKLEKE